MLMMPPQVTEVFSWLFVLQPLPYQSRQFASADRFGSSRPFAKGFYYTQFHLCIVKSLAMRELSLKSVTVAWAIPVKRFIK
jgi:hypothetical protein